MYDRCPGDARDVPQLGPVDVPISNFCIFVSPVENSHRCVKQGQLHLKDTFFIKSSIFCWSPKTPKSPLKVSWRSQSLGSLGGLHGMSPGRRVPAGLLVEMENLQIAYEVQPDR